MRLAFYYHIPISHQSDGFYLPGFLGIFIDYLAGNCDQLFFLAHKSTDVDTINSDYKLKSNNIILVDLGLKTPAWHRELFHKKVLKKRLESIEKCDALIVRSPTPLASHFHRYINHPKLIFMIVGDYVKGINHLKKSGIRNRLIFYYLHLNDYFFQRQIKRTQLIVNSPGLYDKYIKVNQNIDLIKTTTLTNSDFFYRENTCTTNIINILYTGSYSIAKGLFELIEAFNYVLSRKISAHLHLVGWEDDHNKPVEKSILNKISELGISSAVTIHGRMQLGYELNTMYRMADIYAIPSHHEGFPRTIWEAMANSLPVVATNVGGIPRYLTNEKHALLIQPKNVSHLAEALIRLISDSNLRNKLIKNAYTLTLDNTLEIQTKKLIEIIKNKL